MSVATRKTKGAGLYFQDSVSKDGYCVQLKSGALAVTRVANDVLGSDIFTMDNSTLTLNADLNLTGATANYYKDGDVLAGEPTIDPDASSNLSSTKTTLNGWSAVAPEASLSYANNITYGTTQSGGMEQSFTLGIASYYVIDIALAFGPTLGNLSILVDGSEVTTVNAYSASLRVETVSLNVSLSDGSHTLKIANDGTKDAGSSGYGFGVAAVAVYASSGEAPYFGSVSSSIIAKATGAIGVGKNPDSGTKVDVDGVINVSQRYLCHSNGAPFLNLHVRFMQAVANSGSNPHTYGMVVGAYTEGASEYLLGYAVPCDMIVYNAVISRDSDSGSTANYTVAISKNSTSSYTTTTNTVSVGSGQSKVATFSANTAFAQGDILRCQVTTTVTTSEFMVIIQCAQTA